MGALADMANGVKIGDMYAFMIPFGVSSLSLSERKVCSKLEI